MNKILIINFKNHISMNFTPYCFYYVQSTDLKQLENLMVLTKNARGYSGVSCIYLRVSQTYVAEVPIYKREI